MSKSKFGLVPVEKTEIIDLTPSTLTPSSSEGKIDWGNELPKHAGDIVEIAKAVMEGKISIAKIEAETAAKVRLLNKELDRIWQESNARIAQMEKEGKIWLDKFEARKSLLMEVLRRIEINSEWTKEEKTSLIDAAKELIKKD